MIRKIISEEEKKKKEQRNKLIISLFLAAVLIFSTAGYFISDFSSNKQEKTVYNGVEFKKNEYGRWTFKAGGQDFNTAFNPYETENVTIASIKTFYTYSGQPLYFSGDLENERPQEAINEILLNIDKFLARNNFACITSNCTGDYPSKNCSSDNVIIFKKSSSNNTSLYDEDKCLIISYSELDAEKAADAFIFKILGIR